jgi:uncharacterized membrane protein YphA (DoxX/SURF4 family)
MSNHQPFRSGRVVELVAVGARWLVGGLFVYMGLSKALHPEAFLKLIRQYDLVTQPFLLNSIAASLPWFEVFCGSLLLVGVAVRGTALAVLAMLVPFTWIVFRRALAIAGAQGLAFCAVKFDCGCGAGEVLICHKLIENGLLILICGWLITGRGRALSARFNLWLASAPSGAPTDDEGLKARSIPENPPAATTDRPR